MRGREQELAGVEARLKSLEELEAARAGYGDAARAVLAQANGKVAQQGAVADYLEVEAGFERAVEACLGDLLQHVVVERPEHAAAGFQLVRERAPDAAASSSRPRRGRHRRASRRLRHCCQRRCLRTSPASADGGRGYGRPMSCRLDLPVLPDGVVALSSVVRVTGSFAGAIRSAIGDAWIADGYEQAAAASRLTAARSRPGPAMSFAAPMWSTAEAAKKRAASCKPSARSRNCAIASATTAMPWPGSREETAGFEATIAQAANSIAALNAEHHRQEKAIVGYDAQLQHAGDEAARLAQKGEQLVRERRQAEDERDALDRRQLEARESIARLEHDQRWPTSG